MNEALTHSGDRVVLLVNGDSASPAGGRNGARRATEVARLRRLWVSRSRLARWTAAGLVLSTVVAFALPKRYQATTRLMPPDQRSRISPALLAAAGSGMANLAGLASDLVGIPRSGAVFVGILGSRTVEDRLIAQFGLQSVYGEKRVEDARKVLESRTEIAEERKSGIIRVTVTDRDPKRAAGLATAYVNELNRLVAELSTSSAHRERVFLEERLKEVKQDLDVSAKQFSEFASKSGAIDIKEQGRAMVLAATSLQAELIAAESELRGLEQIYTDGNVRVRALRARVAELRKQLANLGGKDGAAEVSLGDEKAVYPSIRKLPLLGVTYADLYRRQKIQETVFELLTQQYELAKVEEAKEIPSVKVLDAPVVPEKKSFPPRLLIMVAGTALAFLGCAGWILGAGAWEQADPQDPAKILALEVYSTVRQRLPALSENGGPWSRLARRLRQRRLNGADGVAARSQGNGVGKGDKDSSGANEPARGEE